MDYEKLEKENRELRNKVKCLISELEILRYELRETNLGIMALYSEIDNKNAELELKNSELAKTLMELKASEEARINAAKVAAAGSVVITYNHEINNPLSVIIWALDVLKIYEQNFDESKLSIKVKEYHNKIMESAERIRNVVEKIREYEELLPTAYLDKEMLDIHSNEE